MGATVKILCPHHASGCKWTASLFLPSDHETVESLVQEHLDDAHEGLGA